MGKKGGFWGLLVVVALGVAALFLLRLRHAAGEEESGEAETEVAVHTAAVRRATLHRYVTVYGRVEPAPAVDGRPPARAAVSAALAGVLVGIDCAEGQRVAAGATLFRLDPRLAEVEVETARQALELAETTLARQRALLEVDGTSRRAVQDAEGQRDAAAGRLAAATAALDLLTVKSPLAGTVIRIDAHLGQEIAPDVDLAEVVDLDRLVIAAGVPRREAGALALGQAVELPGSDAPGRLLYLGSVVDPATDTLPVRLALPPGAAVAPGQLVEARIVAEERRDRLAVPLDALVTRAGEGSWVMVVEGERARRVAVAPGLREGGLVEVEGEGLVEGTTVVTDEAYSLPEETQVRIVGR